MCPYLSSEPWTMNTMMTKAVTHSEGDCGTAGIRSCSGRVMNRELQSEHTFCSRVIVSFIGRMYHYSPNNCFRQIVYLGCSEYHEYCQSLLMFCPVFSIICSPQPYSNSCSFTSYFMTKLSPFWPHNNENFILFQPAFLHESIFLFYTPHFQTKHFFKKSNLRWAMRIESYTVLLPLWLFSVV